MRGKVLRSCHEGGKPRDHPRLCGEKPTHSYTFPLARGSPPPMRGKAKDKKYWWQMIRITPAYAGKRIDWNFNPVAYKDHPRLCGEKCLRRIPIHPDRGSPPPMRGKARRCALAGGVVRITPAYAGKSPNTKIPPRGRQDHPRLCGEKPVCKAVSTTSEGSPPPMRGKASVFREWKSGKGITPAYAGKS